MKLLSASAIVLSVSFLLYSCKDETPTSETKTPGTAPAMKVIHYAVTNSFPHDTTLYTEGFLFHEGKLYESTGSPDQLPQTRSLIGTVDLATGKTEIKIVLDRTKFFGEGIVFFKDKLYQLTYKNRMGFIYDARSFKQTGTFNYSNAEGWGLTADGTALIMSDGTAKLTCLHPDSLKPVRTITVTENGTPVINLNELEYIRGFIYANVWQANYIVKIDPNNGKVLGRIDLTSLVFDAKNKSVNAEVLNGIAHDPATDKVYVTGKLWPDIYEISFPH
jgi:glutamine cyclotransferase